MHVAVEVVGDKREGIVIGASKDPLVSTPTKSVDRGALLSSVSAAETATVTLRRAAATRRAVSEMPGRLIASPASAVPRASVGTVICARSA